MTNGMNTPGADFLRKNIGKLLFLFTMLLSFSAISLLMHDWGSFLIVLPFLSGFSALAHDYFAFRAPFVCSKHPLISIQSHKALNHALRLPYERLLLPCIVLEAVLKFFYKRRKASASGCEFYRSLVNIRAKVIWRQ
jgi:hypothetical protein